jgi:putative hydrolase of the HAD superfamily
MKTFREKGRGWQAPIQEHIQKPNMSKKAIIYDLDNTIYPVSSIGNELFTSLFQLIDQDGGHTENMEAIKADIMRKPFQVVAADYHFSRQLTQRGIALLKDLTYEGVIEPFSDYREVKHLPGERFLVTTGFLKLQQSKIRKMGLEQDFKDIHIVDPATSDKTKKEVFAEIMDKHGYRPEEVLVVGDDPDSEIRAAQELGIAAVLYDKFNLYPANISTPKIADFKKLIEYVRAR